MYFYDFSGETEGAEKMRSKKIRFADHPTPRKEHTKVYSLLYI